MTDFSDDDDSVGYKKPPKKNQFKKGQSGNPKGRPPDKYIHQLIDIILNEKITVKKNGQSVTMTKKEMVLEQLVNKSMQGKNGSIKILLKFLKDLYETPPI